MDCGGINHLFDRLLDQTQRMQIYSGNSNCSYSFLSNVTMIGGRVPRHTSFGTTAWFHVSCDVEPNIT